MSEERTPRFWEAYGNIKKHPELKDDLKAIEERMAYLGSWIVGQDARIKELVEALSTIAESMDAGRHDGLPEECPAHNDYVMWQLAKDTLASFEKETKE